MSYEELHNSGYVPERTKGATTPLLGNVASDLHSMHRALFGLGAVPAPIDEGFSSTPFDYGVVDVRRGSDGNLDLLALQTPLTAGQTQLAWAAIAGCVLSGVGLLYLAWCTTLVKEGEVALVQSYDGRMRALGRGLHLLDTVGTRVRVCQLQDDVVQHGLISIVRVRPGYVGLALDNGRPCVLLPGRHLVNNALFVFAGVKPLTEEHIDVGTLHIITVPSDKVGLASVASVAHILSPGRHLFNTPAFAYGGLHPADMEHIALHSKHRVFVPRGRVGLFAVDGAPTLARPGLHFADHARFAWGGVFDAARTYMCLGSLHRVFVPAGYVAAYTDGGMGHIVHETGERVVDSPTFVFDRLYPATEPYIRVASAARVVVPSGSLGRLTVNGAARLLEPGVHTFNEPTLSWGGVEDATVPLIVHGHIKVMLVRHGTWGITYDDGELVVLNPGRHVIAKATHAVAGVLTAVTTVYKLKGVRTLTGDNVPLEFSAALSLSVVDPALAVPKLCGALFSLTQMEDTIRQKMELLLNSVIGSVRFNQAFAATSRVSAAAPPRAVFDSDKLLDGGAAAPPGSLVPLPGASAALMDALAPVSTVPTVASHGRGFSFEFADPTAHAHAHAQAHAQAHTPDAPAADPNTFKQHVHDAFLQE